MDIDASSSGLIAAFANAFLDFSTWWLIVPVDKMCSRSDRWCNIKPSSPSGSGARLNMLAIAASPFTTSLSPVSRSGISSLNLKKVIISCSANGSLAIASVATRGVNSACNAPTPNPTISFS